MLIVADNLHIVDQTISKAVLSEDPVPIKSLVKQIIQSGSNALDVNCGPLSRSPEKIRFILEAVSEVTDMPLFLDTTNANAMEIGLTFCGEKGRKCVINGFSLEPKKIESILPLAKAYHADIIGYLLFPNSMVPSGEEEMMETAVMVYEAFKQADIPEDRLIIDPIVAPLSWGNGARHNRDLVSVIRNLPDLLGFPVRTICGVSNLTTGAGDKKKKITMESAFAAILTAAGLDMALMNICHIQTIRTIKASTALMSDSIFSWAQIE